MRYYCYDFCALTERKTLSCVLCKNSAPRELDDYDQTSTRDLRRMLYVTTIWILHVQILFVSRTTTTFLAA